MPHSDARFGLLVPVKPTAVAKSRLSPLGDTARQALVVAFAADTVAAALACPLVSTVLAVTDDHVLAAQLAGLGARVLPDGTADDLNGSLVQGAAEVHRRWPELRVAALTADLPALKPEELARALAAASGQRLSFVPDAEGTGTTLLAAPSVELFSPRFGTGSREAHLALGGEELEPGDVPGLRRDVDRPEDLAAAAGLGLGPRTAAVLAGTRL